MSILRITTCVSVTTTPTSTSAWDSRKAPARHASHRSRSVLSSRVIWSPAPLISIAVATPAAPTSPPAAWPSSIKYRSGCEMGVRERERSSRSASRFAAWASRAACHPRYRTSSSWNLATRPLTSSSRSVAGCAIGAARSVVSSLCLRAPLGSVTSKRRASLVLNPAELRSGILSDFIRGMETANPPSEPAATARSSGIFTNPTTLAFFMPNASSSRRVTRSVRPSTPPSIKIMSVSSHAGFNVPRCTVVSADSFSCFLKEPSPPEILRGASSSTVMRTWGSLFPLLSVAGMRSAETTVTWSSNDGALAREAERASTSTPAGGGKSWSCSRCKWNLRLILAFAPSLPFTMLEPLGVRSS
mmetsp:Transcript_5299/g.12765  ORF Transcript_5299/g.12765 Transcript_5299/m.12765 type:complete len:359 (-) Transcript_5299:338-1414(-)